MGVGVEKLDKYLRLPVHCGRERKLKVSNAEKLMRVSSVGLSSFDLGFRFFNGNRARCAKL